MLVTAILLAKNSFPEQKGGTTAATAKSMSVSTLCTHPQEGDRRFTLQSNA